MTAHAAAVFGGERLLLDDALEEMAITDRVYHDLKHTQPLVEFLVTRIRSLAPSGRVLLVAPNATLPVALQKLGYELSVWHVPHGILTEDLLRDAERTAPLDQLMVDDGGEAVFDVIVLPMILEAIAEHPAAVLDRLRGRLRPKGRLLVAYRRSGGLTHRLSALTGSPSLPDPLLDRPRLSFSWPLLPERRSFSTRELRGWCLEAGLRLERESLVVDRHAAVPTNAMTVAGWVGAEAGHAVRVAVPGLRDCAVAEIAQLPAAARRLRRGAQAQDALPFVTVAAGRPRQGNLGRLLAALADQSYPAGRFEVIVASAGDETLPEPGSLPFAFRTVECAEASGPVAANALMRAASGEIVAMTDTCAVPPRGWLDTGAETMSGFAVAVAGRVMANRSSAQPFLALPGAQSTERDTGWFPTANSFYLKDAALEAGGFDEKDQLRSGQRLGWENRLAARLRALGYPTRFDPLLYTERHFPFPTRGRGAWMADEFRRAYELPGEIARQPALRGRLLWRGLFAARRTMYFDLLLVGVVLAVVFRQPLWLLLSAHWLLAVVPKYVPLWPASAWGTAARNLRGIVFRHLLWALGLAAGSVRARRLVL